MRTNYPFLFKNEGMLFSHLIIKWLLHMRLIVCVCGCEFQDEILLKGEECKT